MNLRSDDALRRVAILAMLSAFPAALAGQDIFVPSGIDRWGPRLNEIDGELHSREIWRGLALGSWALEADADIGIWGRPVTATGSWGVSGSVGLRHIFDPAPAPVFETQAEVGLGIVRRIRFVEVRLDGSVYRRLRPGTDGTSAEVRLLVDSLEVPWFQERRPTLSIAGVFDFGGSDHLHLEADLVHDLLLQDKGLWYGTRLSWNDYVTGDVRLQAWDVSVGYVQTLMSKTSATLVGSAELGGTKLRGSSFLGWLIVAVGLSL